MCPACHNQASDLISAEQDHYICQLCGHRFSKSGEVIGFQELEEDRKKGS
jgi:transposase-like protein